MDVSEREDVASEDRRTEAKTFRPAALLPALLIFAGASVLVGAHVAAFRPLSPFDEGVHFDYVVEASRGEIVRKGEKLGQEAMREMACRGIDVDGAPLPPCDSAPFQPGEFAGEGFSSAEVHPPVYYFVTGPLARGLVATGLAPDLFTAARLVGILWLGLGLLSIWLAGKELGLETGPLAAVVAAVAAVPTLLHASATVTNDATGLVAGGLLTWVTLRWERGSTPSWLLGAVGFLALALKTTNALAVAVCVLYLFLRPRPADEAIQPRGSSRRAAAMLAAGAVFGLFAWIVLRAVLATPVDIPTDDPTALRLIDVLAHLVTLITPVSYGVPTAVLGETAFWASGGFVGVLMIGATVGPVLRGSFSNARERLAGSAGMTMLFGGVAFALASYLLYGKVVVSPRYGLSLIAVLAVSLAGAIRSRAVVWGLGLFAAGQLGLVLWELSSS